MLRGVRSGHSEFAATMTTQVMTVAEMRDDSSNTWAVSKCIRLATKKSSKVLIQDSFNEELFGDPAAAHAAAHRVATIVDP